MEILKWKEKKRKRKRKEEENLTGPDSPIRPIHSPLSRAPAQHASSDADMWNPQGSLSLHARAYSLHPVALARWAHCPSSHFNLVLLKQALDRWGPFGSRFTRAHIATQSLHFVAHPSSSPTPHATPTLRLCWLAVRWDPPAIVRPVRLLLGAFVFRRSSKIWFNNIFQVLHMNRYLRTRVKSIYNMESLIGTKVDRDEGWTSAEAVRKEASAQ